MGVAYALTPLAEKFIHVALVSVNANQHIQFQLPSSISLGDIGGGRAGGKIKIGGY